MAYDCTPGRRCNGEYVCDNHDGPEGWRCVGCGTIYWRGSTREPFEICACMKEPSNGRG
jgi:uncharacterized protein with PIN domain